MDECELLRKLAEVEIVAESGKALDAIGEAAAALLADLYAAGLAPGITPDDWAWVTALPSACWDASRALARRQQSALDGPLGVSEDRRVTKLCPGSELRLGSFRDSGSPYRLPPAPVRR